MESTAAMVSPGSDRVDNSVSLANPFQAARVFSSGAFIAIGFTPVRPPAISRVAVRWTRPIGISVAPVAWLSASSRPWTRMVSTTRTYHTNPSHKYCFTCQIHLIMQQISSGSLFLPRLLGINYIKRGEGNRNAGGSRLSSTCGQTPENAIWILAEFVIKLIINYASPNPVVVPRGQKP